MERVSLCPQCTECSEVVIDGDTIRIGEDENIVVLKKTEWNVLVADGFVRIRHFGFLANRTRRAKLARCRALLAQPPAPAASAIESVSALMRRLTGSTSNAVRCASRASCTSPRSSPRLPRSREESRSWTRRDRACAGPRPSTRSPTRILRSPSAPRPEARARSSRPGGAQRRSAAWAHRHLLVVVAAATLKRLPHHPRPV